VKKEKENNKVKILWVVVVVVVVTGLVQFWKLLFDLAGLEIRAVLKFSER
jgi:hypothetical protein